MNKELEDLKALLLSNEWPYAVDPLMICDENLEQDKFERAAGILDTVVDINFSGLKFLDFGCGEGHTVLEAKKRNAIAYGYDPIQKGNLYDGIEITNDFNIVESNAPYNIILLYDVIDHCDSPIEILQQVKKISNKDTKIFIRCHPWTSRHASHLYKKMNKAFMHLVFTQQELAEMGFELEKGQRFLWPLKTYRQLFLDSGLKVISENIEKQLPELFFKNNKLIFSRISRLFGIQSFPEFQTSQNFVDYTVQLM